MYIYSMMYKLNMTSVGLSNVPITMDRQRVIWPIVICRYHIDSSERNINSGEIYICLCQHHNVVFSGLIMVHVFLLAQHQFCNINSSYLEGHNKRHHTSVTPAACPASKEQPALPPPNASPSTQSPCPSFPSSGGWGNKTLTKKILM